MSLSERRPPGRSVSRLLWQTSGAATWEPPTTTTPVGGPRTSTSSAAVRPAPVRAPAAYGDNQPDTPRGGEERQRRSSTTSNNGGAPPLARSSSQRRMSVPTLPNTADARTDAWVASALNSAAAGEEGEDDPTQDLAARAHQLRAKAALLEAAAVVVAGPPGGGRGHVTDGESVAKAASKPPRRSSTSKPREAAPRPAACTPAGLPPWECLAQVRLPPACAVRRAGGYGSGGYGKQQPLYLVATERARVPPRGAPPPWLRLPLFWCLPPASDTRVHPTCAALPPPLVQAWTDLTVQLCSGWPQGAPPTKSNSTGSTIVRPGAVATQPRGQKPVRSNTRRIDLPGGGTDSAPTTPGSDTEGNVFAQNTAAAAPERSLTRVLSDSSLSGAERSRPEPRLSASSSRRILHPLVPSLSQTRMGLSVRTDKELNRADGQPGSAKSGGDGDTPKGAASHMMWQPNGVRSTHFKVKYVPPVTK